MAARAGRGGELREHQGFRSESSSGSIDSDCRDGELCEKQGLRPANSIGSIDSVRRANSTGSVDSVYREKRDSWLNIKRWIWRPLLLLWHFWIGRRMPAVKYANDTHILPGWYSPPSVLSCCIYIALILEMLYIGLVSDRLATGAIIAYYMGEVFLYAGNFVMGGTAIVLSVTDTQIREWRPPGFEHHPSLLKKLMRHGEKGSASMCIALTNDDLMMLKELKVKENVPRYISDRHESRSGTVDDIGVFEYVWLFDDKEILYLVNGDRSELSEGYKSMLPQFPLHRGSKDASSKKMCSKKQHKNGMQEVPVETQNDPEVN